NHRVSGAREAPADRRADSAHAAGDEGDPRNDRLLAFFPGEGLPDDLCLISHFLPFLSSVRLLSLSAASSAPLQVLRPCRLRCTARRAPSSRRASASRAA